jgi:ATP-dependent helicase/nuclease subunit A
MRIPEQAMEQDARARRVALDVTRSMLLQAPAGSGKTTVLTARFLALLAAVDAPEEILAVTFTRKAAAEMRHRVIEALEAANSGQEITGIEPALMRAACARDMRQGWDLRRNPSRLRIQTIDSLNYWLASQLPISARSASNLHIASAVDPLYRRAARRCLMQSMTEQETVAAANLLFERLDNDWQRVEKLLAAMLKGRSHWLSRVLVAGSEGLLERVERSLDSVLRGELARCMSAFTPELLRVSEGVLTHVLRTRAELSTQERVELTGDPRSIQRWRSLARLALREDGEWRKSFTRTDGVDDKTIKARVEAWRDSLMRRPSMQEAIGSLRLLPERQLCAADLGAVQALALLLRLAAAELQQVFAVSGRVDFCYVAGAARQALTEQNEPSDLALRTGMALRHILVDEFQDTSFDQLDLLLALTAGWEPNDGRSLFLVGDPMQSIYQFRDAEVGLFVRSRDQGVGSIALEPLQLRRNFRSRAAIIDWVNEHFAQLFPPEDDARLAAIRYLSSAAGSDAARDEASAVTLHAFEEKDYAGEGRRVVDIVRSARKRNPAVSIAVLVAARPHATALVARLGAAGFVVRGVDLEPLNERAVVRDLAALARALMHGADRTAWLALLRSPFCGLTLVELESVFAGNEGDLFARLQTYAQPNCALRSRIGRLCASLQPAILGAERGLPLWRRVEQCWLRLGGPAVHSREVDRLDAHRFIDALAAHEDPEALAGDSITEITKSLYSSSPPQDGAIDVMTIHSAKGLEWDVVILPGLGRVTAPTRDPLLHWIELPRATAGTDLLLAPIKATDEELPTSLAAYIKRLRRERIDVERVRLLYVAATRARLALHLMGGLMPETPRSQPAPRNGSLLSVLWSTIGEQFLAGYLEIPAAKSATGVTAVDAVDSLRRLPPGWSIPEPPTRIAVSRLALTSPSSSDAPEYRWVGLTARAIGTIVHAELHRLANAGAAKALPDYDAWLSELGVGPAELPSAGARIREALQRTLEDSRGRWLLADTHREAHSEWRLTGLHEGRVVNVIFDRMVVDEHGQRWVVDYKTSTHEGGAVGEFIDREAERYRSQMQRYAAMAAHIDGSPVRAALYFPLLGVFRELSVDHSVPASEKVR